MTRLGVLEFSSCIVTFIRHGAYEALAELTAFSTRSMRNTADDCALDGLQSIKNLLASGETEGKKLEGCGCDAID